MLMLVALLIALPGASAEHVPSVSLYVNDYSSPPILLYSEWSDLEDLCYLIDSVTSAEVGVLIVNSTQPFGIDDLAVEVFNEAGIGKADLDNGVLIVVSIDEQQWRIEVGRGIEYVLNDAKVGRIGRDRLEPNLSSEFTFHPGLKDAIYDIGIEIEENYEEARPNDPQPWKVDWTPVIGGLVLTGVVGVATKGRVILSPTMFVGRRGLPMVRGGFGGGSSGHGGARGWFRR